jgi:hypothetical protein
MPDLVARSMTAIVPRYVGSSSGTVEGDGLAGCAGALATLGMVGASVGVDDRHADPTTRARTRITGHRSRFIGDIVPRTGNRTSRRV